MKEVIGNILDNLKEDEVTIICHQVNCRGVMGKGLAKQIKEKFPNVYISYKKACLDHGNRNLGRVQYCVCDESCKHIVANIFGQDYYGTNRCYTDYFALEQAFKDIAAICRGYTIRIPYKIGCGLGGGDWKTVLELIENYLDKYCNVEIWKLPE